MPGDDYLSVPHASDNPAPLNKRSAEDIRAEIARVDKAIAAIAILAAAGRERVFRIADPDIGRDPKSWPPPRIAAEFSIPVALRSMMRYRKRLARSGR